MNAQRLRLTLLFSVISQTTGICAAPAPPAAAPVPSGSLLVVQWGKLQELGQLKNGDVVPGKNGQPDRLKVVNTEKGLRSIFLCDLVAPPITTPSYALRGTIAYENVVGDGYLEMWNHFPDGGSYFTRTMDPTGPMAVVTGNSPERQFLLPFHISRKSPAPRKLELNLVLNGPGTVEIGPLELVAIDAMALRNGSEWWSGSTAGMFGGIGGTLLGLLGAAIGVLTGVGKGKHVVLTLSAIMAAAGGLVLIGGLAAVVTGQPYHVFYPLLLLGGMMSVGGTVSLFVAPGRFRDHELQRMRTLDLT